MILPHDPKPTSWHRLVVKWGILLSALQQDDHSSLPTVLCDLVQSYFNYVKVKLSGTCLTINQDEEIDSRYAALGLTLPQVLDRLRDKTNFQFNRQQVSNIANLTSLMVTMMSHPPAAQQYVFTNLEITAAATTGVSILAYLSEYSEENLGNKTSQTYTTCSQFFAQIKDDIEYVDIEPKIDNLAQLNPNNI